MCVQRKRAPRLFASILYSSGRKGAAWADTQGARHRVSRLVELPLCSSKTAPGNEGSLLTAQQTETAMEKKRLREKRDGIIYILYIYTHVVESS